MRLRSIQLLAAAGVVAAVAAGIITALHYDVPRATIVSWLGSALGTAVGIGGAIFTAMYLSDRKRRKEVDWIKQAFTALIANLSENAPNLPTATGPRDRDESLAKLQHGCKTLAATFESAAQHAAELDFFQRAIVKAWPERCINLYENATEYATRIDRFRVGTEYDHICDRAHTDLQALITDTVRQAKRDRDAL